MEKEKRKNERAAKKKGREQFMQKKKEERVKKAEERARKAEEKAKTSRRWETKRRFSEIGPKLPTTESSLLTSEPSSVYTDATSGTATGGSYPDTCTDGNNDGIDINVCSMCFVHYNDNVMEGGGTDWIFCKCGRWLHEDCVEEVVTDSDGVERFCSFCVDKYTA